MNILIIGSGGREHAIAWKVAQSPKTYETLHCLLAIPARRFWVKMSVGFRWRIIRPSFVFASKNRLIS